MIGTTGDDRLVGTSGPDYIYANAGNDVLQGGGGTDYLRGSFGNDSMDGGLGNDFLQAGPDNDNLIGGYGRDVLLGQNGVDRLDGGGDSDTISGGTGRDQLSGGGEADRFVFISVRDSLKSAPDLITDFSLGGGDLIDLSSINVTSPLDWISSEAFSAVNQVRATALPTGRTLVEVNTSGAGGAEMAFEINGTGTLQEHHFQLTGGITTDDSTPSVKVGTPRSETFSTGGGEDYIYGDAGNDDLRGEGDSDIVRGSFGNDRINGGAGDDALYGGPDADVFIASPGYDLVQDFSRKHLDKIEVASPTINSFEQLTISQQVGGALVTVADVGSLYVSGIDAASMTASDFIFT